MPTRQARLRPACPRWFGESGIPDEWRRDLAGKDLIEPILGRLIQ